ncbi:MAG TPA: UvrD-helicase domain-containing protein, partial [Firmicutes bacterium]|nr:UvrD-helicase domain-containing protein [Bacillota bacterium]
LDYWENTTAKVYKLYQEKLRANNALDFDDLIMVTVNLLQNHKDVLNKYQDRFSHILVDEYQDTNHAQYVLIRLLAQKSGNICVVGDEDQSIYAFRGADIRNILEFEKDFPGARIIKLEENYRSTKNILGAANSVIKHNTERKEKRLWTSKAAGAKVGFYQGENEWKEAAFIARTIERLQREGGRNFSQFALLYRTHALSRVLEEEFIRRAIPYRIVSGLRFYDRREIKDLLAYLRLIYNPQDDFSFRRIINVPRRGIGEVTLNRLASYAAEFGLSLFESLSYLDGIEGLGARFLRALGEFKEMTARLREQADKLSLTELTERVLVESGYLDDLERQGDEEALGRRENLQEFLSVTKQFEKEEGPDLGALLEHVALISDVDTYDQAADAVSLMTLHASKGLEFPVVFVCGMEEGIFPHARSLEEPGEIEEERRLAYVGMTRAQEHLFLSCAKVRTLYGATKRMLVSPFVEEIDARFLENHGQPGALTHLSGIIPKRNGSKDTEAEYKAGDKVKHEAWGEGMVVSVKDAHGDLQLSIVFPEHGLKTVIAHYAPLVKI